jgi:hypothetical protein
MREGDAANSAGRSRLVKWNGPIWLADHARAADKTGIIDERVDPRTGGEDFRRGVAHATEVREVDRDGRQPSAGNFSPDASRDPIILFGVARSHHDFRPVFGERAHGFGAQASRTAGHDEDLTREIDVL